MENNRSCNYIWGQLIQLDQSGPVPTPQRDYQKVTQEIQPNQEVCGQPWSPWKSSPWKDPSLEEVGPPAGAASALAVAASALAVWGAGVWRRPWRPVGRWLRVRARPRRVRGEYGRDCSCVLPPARRGRRLLRGRRPCCLSHPPLLGCLRKSRLRLDISSRLRGECLAASASATDCKLQHSTQ